MSKEVFDDEMIDIQGLDKNFIAPPNEYKLSELAKYLKSIGKTGKELSEKELALFRY